MEEKQAYPSFVQSIGLISMFFIGAVLFVYISKYLQIAEETVLYTIVKNIFSIFVYYFPVYYAISKNSTTFKQTLGDFMSAKHYIIPAIIFIAGFRYMLLPIEYFLKYFLYGITDIYLEDTLIHFIDNTCTILIFPIFEEILFRGLILKSFLKHYGTVKAIFLSSVLFGVLHVSATAVLNAFIISIIISYLYIRTRSVWICIIAHAVSNAISTGCFDYILIHYLHFTLSTYAITGIIIAAAGFCLFNKAYSKQQNETTSAENEI